MATTGQPTWIGPVDQAVAAWVEVPETRQARGVVVVAPSVGREGVASWRAMHTLGRRLAESGYASVRFDWRGDGSSAPLPDDGLVDGWVQDLEAAVDHARCLAGELPVHVVGLRLGAALVHRWGGQVSGRVVLWEPVSGRTFLRLHQKLRVLGTDIPPLPPEAGVELSGTFYTPAQAEDLRSLKAVKAAGAPEGVTVRVETDRDVSDHLYFAAPRYARVPYAAIDEIVSGLGGELVLPLQTPPRRTRATFQVRGQSVQEEFVRVGPHHLHGIVTYPPGEVVEGVLFTSAGGEPLDGPTGLWTSAARVAAGKGALCLRTERRELGVHMDPSVPLEPNPYTPEAVQDVAAEVAHLRALTDRPLTGVGLCVGAWLFFRAGAVEPMERVLALDNVMWATGYRYIARYFREPLLRRFLTEEPVRPAEGDGEPAGTWVSRPGARTVIKEQLKAVRELARWRPLPARRLLAGSGRAEYPYAVLATLPATTEVLIQFGAEAADHFHEVHGVESLARLRAEGRAISVRRWDDLDHSLLAESARRRALQLVASLVDRQ